MRTLLPSLIALSLCAGLGAYAEEKADVKPEATKTEVVTADKLPAAVKATLDKEHPGAEIAKVEKIAGEKVKYRIHFKQDKKEHQITILEDGSLAKGHHDHDGKDDKKDGDKKDDKKDGDKKEDKKDEKKAP